MNPLVETSEARLPIVASIPHGGEYLPRGLADALLLELDQIYLDWYTPELYSFLPTVGIPCVIAQMHRVVADVNRQAVDPLVGPYLRSVVAESYGQQPLYPAPPSDSQAWAQVALAYTPYHAALDALVQEATSRFRNAIVIDLHSFGRPLDCDIVLGDARGASASSRVVGEIESCFRNHGFSVQRNEPWTGGWITKKYSDDPSVDGVLIEVNQRIYLNPSEIDRLDASRPTRDGATIQTGAERLRGVIEEFVDLVRTSNGIADSHNA